MPLNLHAILHGGLYGNLGFGAMFALFKERNVIDKPTSNVTLLVNERIAEVDVILYHYCSVEKFLKILQSGKFWLTDLDRTNDSQEIKYGNKKLFEHYLKVTGIDKAEAIGFEREIELANHAGYAFCMSSESDLLSQWRAYADDSKGVAIGISIEALKNVDKCYPWYGIGPEEIYGYEKVIYTIEEINRAIIESKEMSSLIKDNIDIKKIEINDLKTLIIKNNPNQDFNELYKQFCLSIAPIAFFIKNDSFKEEHEYRIISRSVTDKTIIFGGGAKYFQNYSGVQRFEKQGKIISYREYEYKKFNPLREIMLGSKCIMSENDMRYELSDFGLGNIQINKSKSTYR